MPDADLTTLERGKLHGALASAFYDLGRLDDLLFLSDGLGISLDEIAGPLPLPRAVTAVIKWAEGEGKTDTLIRAAYKKVPGNYQLRAFYASYTSTAQRQVSRSALQSLTDSAVQYKNPMGWRDRMAQAENCVCCIAIDGDREGTGFLVAPGVVLTNHHVVDGAGWQSISVEFDYRANAAGQLTASRYYTLQEAPIAVSPPHDIDEKHPKPKAPPPDDTALDFAVLALNGKPEEDLMTDGSARGFIAPPAAAPTLVKDMPLLILQHPQKPPKYLEAPDLRPLLFAFDKVLEINDNASRVTYKVQTEPGASGSPCFDSDWNLVALHHAGDPRKIVPAEYNEGIPIASIRRSLPAGVRTRLQWV